MTDERQGKPSASKFPRYVQCAGSYQFEERLRAEGDLCPEGEDEARDAGNRIHQSLAGANVCLLGAEWEVAQRLRDQRMKLNQRLFPGQEPEQERREIRFWFLQSWSAKPDYVALYGHLGLVVNYKTGWGEHEASDASLQLRAEIADLSINYPNVTEWYGAILEPYKEAEIVRYADDDNSLLQARLEATGVVEKLYSENPPLRTGPHCTYCPCRHRCELFQGTALTLSAVDAAKLSKDRLPELLEAAPLAEKAIKAVKEWAKQLLKDDPEAIPGWELKEGRLQREITDPQAAYQALSDTLEPGEFTQACKVQVGKLESLYREKTGLKLAEAKRDLNARLDGVIEEKRASPQLAKKKEEG